MESERANHEKAVVIICLIAILLAGGWFIGSRIFTPDVPVATEAKAPELGSIDISTFLDSSRKPSSQISGGVVYRKVNEELARAYEAIINDVKVSPTQQPSTPFAKEILLRHRRLVDVSKTEALDQAFRAMAMPPIGIKLIERTLGGIAAAAGITQDKDTLLNEFLKIFPRTARPVSLLGAEALTRMGYNGCYLTDARRHVYWAALLAKFYGPDMALVILTTNEIIGRLDWTIPATDRVSQMDILNNLVGITIGVRMSEKSIKEIETEVYASSERGDFVMLNPSMQETPPSWRPLVQSYRQSEYDQTPAVREKSACFPLRKF